ncbi:MAG: TetR/AcrR family transcriptional regulator [Actinomycetota bacterium]
MTRRYHSPLRDRQAAETRTLVLEALADLVTERSSTEFSVQEVADRAQVSLRTIYRYFPNRQALLDGLTDLVDARMDDLRTDPEVGWEDLRDRDLEGLLATVPAVFERFDQLEPLSSAMALLSAGENQRARGHDERTEMFREVLTEDLAHLSPEEKAGAFAVVRHLISSTTWFVLREEHGLDGREAGEAVARAVRAIIRAAPSDS